jgi:hypothetical protein
MKIKPAESQELSLGFSHKLLVYASQACARRWVQRYPLGSGSVAESLGRSWAGLARGKAKAIASLAREHFG